MGDRDDSDDAPSDLSDLTDPLPENENEDEDPSGHMSVTWTHSSTPSTPPSFSV
jgi:hypothetical protein